MIVLQVKDLKKSYGVEEIFRQVGFTVAEGERVALVGPNGAGKSTLFRCITGQEHADEGQIMLSNKIKLGYLEQLPTFLPHTSLFDAVIDVYSDILAQRELLRQLELQMAEHEGEQLQRTMDEYGEVTEQYERAGGFSCESSCRKILLGLGFTEPDLVRDIQSFSGGEKTRASLARLLVRQPDILLLDEPTNHLDLQSVEWLEDYLKEFKGSLLLISHDRYFLDQVTNKTLDLEHGSLQQFNASFTKYLELKAQKLEALTNAYMKQQQEIKATEEYINKYRAGIKSKQARGRQSILNRLDRIAAPQSSAKLILNQAQPIQDTGNQVLQVKGLTFGYDKIILDDVSFEINKGDKVALIGANGTGKSSLLKLVTQRLQQDKGEIRLGSRVKVGYYDQEHGDLNKQNRVIDEITYSFGLSEAEARSYLAAFLFREDDVFKRIADLSGGERGRLSFLKLFMTAPNFLILDEPTNHLDIASKNIIESYLEDFEGSILMVSHDRYFIDKIADRVLELEDCKLTNYLGNYTYYRLKKAQAATSLQTEKNVREQIAPVKQDKEKPKVNKAKTREQIAHIEKEIQAMEERLNELAELLADNTTYQTEESAKEILQEYKALEEKIPQAYDLWEELHNLITES